MSIATRFYSKASGRLHGFYHEISLISERIEDPMKPDASVRAGGTWRAVRQTGQFRLELERRHFLIDSRIVLTSDYTPSPTAGLLQSSSVVSSSLYFPGGRGTGFKRFSTL